jgi:hypothetical protein
LADRFGGFSLVFIIPVHSLDPIPNCQTANVEIIIAQFRVICTGNFVFFSLRSLNAMLLAAGEAAKFEITDVSASPHSRADREASRSAA